MKSQTRSLIALIEIGLRRGLTLSELNHAVVSVAGAVTADVVAKAISGGHEAIVCGALIKVIAKVKVSKNDKEFLSYSFMNAPTEVTPSGWTVTETLESDDNSEEVPF